MDAALIASHLPQLREQQKLSLSQLSRRTVKEGFAGVPEGTIKAIERNPGRVPEARILEALAAALGKPPEVFYEYPIALARARANGAKAPAGDDAPSVPSEAARTLAGHASTRAAEARSRKKQAPGVPKGSAR
jgi:transcriptional regulator with XRE-family HTH domain